MPNGSGLMGNSSSTQSALIIQKPGSTTIYYIFTVDELAYANGIRYSEVDMALNTGLGDVTANKNILLNTPSCEKITGIRHCNNTDVWVVTHDWNSDTFRTYLVTPTGVNPTPVLSNVGLVAGGNINNTIGYLKGSPDGTKLASAIMGINRFELFDFNNSTGIVSNQILFPQNIASARAYGVEFSPDGTKMYGSSWYSGNIYQYDLCAGSNSAIANSGVIIGTSSSSIMGALQLGPDKKIYVARYKDTWLGVVNNPNTIGVGCNYVDNGVYLAGRESRLGLQNFVPWYFKPAPPPFLVSINCLNVNFTAPAVNITNCSISSNAITSVSWNFGDPTSGLSNTSTVSNPSHHFSGAGPYTVSLVLHYACGNDTLRQTVTPINNQATGTDTQTACVNYTWIDGLTYTASNNTATYTIVGGAANGCDSIVTLDLTINPSPTLKLIKIDDSCNSDDGSATAIATSKNLPITYNWNTGATDSSINNLPAGTYNVTVTDSSGCTTSGSITINDSCHYTLIIPNIITPNGDGKNDVFKIQGLSLYSGTKVLIFDRWGREVYKNDDYQNDWDGDDLTDGSYLYIITVNDKEQKVYKGNLTILNSKE